MPTNYETGRFASRYLKARPLSAEFAATWSRLLAARIPADEVAVVLDAGAGIGRFWPVLISAWSPRVVIAVDRSTSMLASATSGARVSRVVGDLDALPVRPNGSVDVVFCSMALHYSRDPRGWVRAAAAMLHPGGWLCVRTGTDETLASFDFLRFFPTALAAERAAMPTTVGLLGWFDTPGVEVDGVEEVTGGPPQPRRWALAAALRGGFPSLQLVPQGELTRGLVRYAVHLLRCWITRTPRPHERSVLVTARRVV